MSEPDAGRPTGGEESARPLPPDGASGRPLPPREGSTGDLPPPREGPGEPVPHGDSGRSLPPREESTDLGHLPPPTGPPAPGESTGLGELPPPTGPAYTGPDDAAAPTGVEAYSRQWQRLDRRMLAVRPLAALPPLMVPIVFVVIGVGRGNTPPFVSGVIVVFTLVVALLAGLVPWLATRYRFTDEHLEVRRGLINISTLTARLDRVRSVDLEAPLAHRLFRVSRVKVGTGVDDARMTLDALDTGQARELQRFLLNRSAEPAAAERPVAATAAQQGADPTRAATETKPQHDRADVELARINWSWLRYAPFGLSGLVIAAAALGVFGQYGGDLLESAGVRPETFEEAADRALALGVLVLVVGGALVLLVGWLVLSTLSYVVQWWNFVLTRTGHGTLSVSRGLFTTRVTSLEEARVRGAQLSTSLPLRWVRGSSGLSALATGVGEGGSSQLLPACPRQVARDVGHAVLEEPTPLVADLVSHGRRAWVRRHVRAQLTTLVLTGLSLLPTLLWDWPAWVPAAVFGVLAVLGVLLAQDRYRNLGHSLTDRYLVSSQGSVLVRRVALEREGIIGWVWQQSWFQRRAGLGTLVATTAAGSESYRVVDIPEHLGTALADAATPGVLDDALAR